MQRFGASIKRIHATAPLAAHHRAYKGLVPLAGVKVALFPAARMLRRGSRGSAVQELQEHLSRLGYETGKIDGHMGYVTEDALMQFQRDHGLRLDGIAGPRVMDALHTADPDARSIHIVRPGETWSDIARQYRVPVAWLRWTNKKTRSKRLYVGERLVIRSSLVFVSTGDRLLAGDLRTLAKRAHLFSGIVDGTTAVEADGSVHVGAEGANRQAIAEAGWPYVLGVSLPGGRGHDLFSGSPPGDDIAQDDIMDHVLRSRRRVRRFVATIGSIVSDKDVRGLLWDVSGVGAGLGGKIASALTSLTRAAPETPIAIAVAPPAPGVRSMIADADYRAFAARVHRLVLALHRWDHLLGPDGGHWSFRRIEAALSRMTRSVPPRKILLGVPFGASAWKDRDLSGATSYQAAITQGYVQRRRLRRDADGSAHMTVSLPPDSTSVRLVLQTAHTLDRLLRLVHHYRLAGVLVHPAGYEDLRQWDILSHRVKARPFPEDLS